MSKKNNFLQKLTLQLSEIICELDGHVAEELVNNFKNPVETNYKGDGMAHLSLGFKGIYLIEIKKESKIKFTEWIDDFRKKWEKFGKHFTPSIKKKREKIHINENKKDEWIPMYLGISKNVGKRLKEHFELKKDKTTYALKLSQRIQLKNQKFRIRTIALNIESDDVYNWILPRVERKLRDAINPIIGKQ